MVDEAVEKVRKLCFVVGPIGEDGTETRRHADWLLKGFIREALIDLGYQVKRADDDAKPGMISDRIIHDILNADLVIADLTELNANAFYELGIRHSTGKPTIHIAKKGLRIPFDNIGHACIFVDIGDYDDVEKKRGMLAASVKQTQQEGFRVSNPITQARAGVQMRESTDPKDVILSQMQDRIVKLEQRDMMTVEDKVEVDTATEIVKILNRAAGVRRSDVHNLGALAFRHWMESNRTITAHDAVDMVLKERKHKIEMDNNGLSRNDGGMQLVKGTPFE